MDWKWATEIPKVLCNLDKCWGYDQKKKFTALLYLTRKTDNTMLIMEVDILNDVKNMGMLYWMGSKDRNRSL